MSALDESAVEATQSINLPAAGFLLLRSEEHTSELQSHHDST